MALLFRDTRGRERYGFVINGTCIPIFSFTILLVTLAHGNPIISGKVTGIADGDTLPLGGKRR